MHFSEADSELFKAFVIKKLENISDADSDVLADYGTLLDCVPSNGLYANPYQSSHWSRVMKT